MPVAVPRRGSAPSRLRCERGSVVASLIILPAVIAFLLFAVHLALVLHGHHVVSAAAHDGLFAAQQNEALEADGVEAANDTLDLYSALTSRSVNVTKDNQLVVVTVEAEITALLGGFLTDISARVEGPPERIYLEGERR